MPVLGLCWGIAAGIAVRCQARCPLYANETIPRHRGRVRACWWRWRGTLSVRIGIALAGRARHCDHARLAARGAVDQRANRTLAGTAAFVATVFLIAVWQGRAVRAPIVGADCGTAAGSWIAAARDPGAGATLCATRLAAGGATLLGEEHLAVDRDLLDGVGAAPPGCPAHRGPRPLRRGCRSARALDAGFFACATAAPRPSLMSILLTRVLPDVRRVEADRGGGFNQNLKIGQVAPSVK